MDSWESTVIKEIKNDLSNFYKLYERYVKDVYRFVYYKVGNVLEAEDITSETFLKALENINKYQIIEGKSIKAWLYTISKNIIIARYKKNIFVTTQEEVIQNIAQEDSSVLDKVCDQDMANQIISYVNKLDPVAVDIIRMKIFDDLTFEEISQITGLNLSTVKMKYYRALQKVKKHFFDKDNS